MARPKNDAVIDLTKAHALTAGLIERLTCRADVKTQAFLRDSVAPGLRVRVTNTGAKSFTFEAKLNRQTIRRTFGDVRSWTIEDARIESNRLRVTLDAGVDPRVVDREARAAKAAAAATREEAEKYTLAHLLFAYCDHQKKIGRRSHADARSIFTLHVVGAWPTVAKQPANTVTSEQIADMMRRVIEMGKGRTANKLRSYVRAAYQIAKASRSKASIPVAFKAFEVKSNPASETEPDESANKADKNPLRVDELRAYWKAVQRIDGFPGALLRLHLLTGGQRIEQLVNLLTADATCDSIALLDGKGRPGKPPRPHLVPLTHDAVVALMECQPGGQYALSTDGGATHVSATTLSKWAMMAGAGIEGFQTKRIRSGVETLLASARISADHRGRLQSHGISGVQARHYDGHDYMNEKRHALETLFGLLQNEPADNVMALKSA